MKPKSVSCPNCNSNIWIQHGKNRWAEWYDFNCETCGYKYKLRDYEFDLVQPSHPLFDEIYKDNPVKRIEAEKKAVERATENMKQEREDKLKSEVRKGNLKPWELKDVKNYTRSRGLE